MMKIYIIFVYIKCMLHHHRPLKLSDPHPSSHVWKLFGIQIPYLIRVHCLHHQHFNRAADFIWYNKLIKLQQKIQVISYLWLETLFTNIYNIWGTGCCQFIQWRHQDPNYNVKHIQQVKYFFFPKIDFFEGIDTTWNIVHQH